MRRTGNFFGNSFRILKNRVERPGGGGHELGNGSWCRRPGDPGIIVAVWEKLRRLGGGLMMATVAEVSTPLDPAEGRIVVSGVDWYHYEKMLEIVGDRRIYLTYDDGTMEVTHAIPTGTSRRLDRWASSSPSSPTRWRSGLLNPGHDHMGRGPTWRRGSNRINVTTSSMRPSSGSGSSWTWTSTRRPIWPSRSISHRARWTGWASMLERRRAGSGGGTMAGV